MKKALHILGIALGAMTWSACCARAVMVEFSQVSDPPGIVNEFTTHETPAGVTTVTAAASSSGYSFTHWEIDEGAGPYRVNDAFGRASNPVAFTIYNNSTATARYRPTTNDVDADGVPDWFEVHYLGTLTNGAAFDGDGDGYSLATEYSLGYNPLFGDRPEDGGVSRGRSAMALVILDPGYFVYRRQSDPMGIHSYSAVVTNGSVDVLPELGDCGGYRFAFWTLNGERLADPFGRSFSTQSITVTGETTAVAHFFPVAEDFDLDGIPDWYERHYYGALSNSAVSDSDGDGFTLAVECSRGYPPHLHDDVVDGGVSRGRSATAVYYGPPYCPYVINSDPGGIVNTYGYVTSGTHVATSTVPADYLGWRFTHWTVNGIRQADPFGVALDAVELVVTGGTVATARYMGGSSDTDADGVPDWYETYFFGDLSQSGASDSDGDGCPLAVEYARGYRPVVADSFVDGGISRTRANVATVNLQPFERVEYALVDGTLTNVFTVWPAGVSGFDFGCNSAPAAGDWDGDGDMDIFVGSSGGVMRVFENTGTRATFDLADRSGSFSDIASRWSDLQNPYPALGDWNNDGKAEMALGGGTGIVRLVSSSANFTGAHSLNVDYAISTGSTSAIPAFADVVGDTNQDLLVLLGDGTVRAYVNTGNPLSPFDSMTYTDNVLNVSVDGATGLSGKDVDRDGMDDVMVSDVYGRIWEFHQGTNRFFALTSRVWGGSEAGFANGLSLAMGDLDGDGDIDALCGYATGGLMFLRDPEIGVPCGLRAFDGADLIRLDWDPNTHYRLKGYYVYRSTSPTGPFSRLSAAILPLPGYVDADIAAGVTYYYRVTAVSGAMYPGNSTPHLVESRPSDTVSASRGRIVLWMSDYNADTGTVATLKVNSSFATGIAGHGMDIRISYDPAVIRPASQVISSNSSVELTALTQGLTVTNNAASANGELRITGAAGVAVGEGHLFDVKFFVLNGVAPGTLTTNRFAWAHLENADELALDVDYSDAAVLNVTGTYSPGDMTGNGIVDHDDCQRLSQMIVEHIVPTSEELTACDLNGNGVLDNIDRQLLHALHTGESVNPP